jgi:uncharacterized protein
MININVPGQVAVIGSGIAGLGCALDLTRRGYSVALYEAQSRLGGHANTVEVTVAGKRLCVDTGFLVFNHKTYPLLLALFADLGVSTAVSEMSFSVSEGPHRFEWAGTNLRSVFAQKRNLLSPSFLRMLVDILRFNRHATRMAEVSCAAQPQQWGLL